MPLNLINHPDDSSESNSLESSDNAVMSAPEKPSEFPPVEPLPPADNSSSRRQSKMPKMSAKFVTKKRLVVFLAIIIILAATAGGYLWQKRHKTTNNGSSQNSTAQTNSKTPASQPNNIRFIAAGDFIAHDAINKQAKQQDGSYQYYPIMQAMAPFFNKADIRFCNNAVPTAGSAFGITGYPVFNSPFEFITDMVHLGCNLVNTGTNHTFDKGQDAINAWVGEWDKQPNMLAVDGANRNATEQQKIHYFTVKGVKFALLSYITYSNTANYNSFSMNNFDKTISQAQVKDAKKNADVVIVSMRWGDEYSPAITALQKDDAQLLADWGADIVIGHGTHVVQPVDWLNAGTTHKTLVWYGIANALNAQLPIETLVDGLPVMDIDTKTKQITNVSYLPTYMHYEWTADQKKREDLLARHNFQWLPLDQAAELLTKSQNNTTVAAQTARLSTMLNSLTPVKLITSSQY